MFAYCVSAAYQEAASVARHRRQRCASRRAPMGAVEERIHRGAGSGASTDVLRDWRPAPRDRRGVGRRPSRSALIWRTTIADWRRRGHRDADARRGARFYPGRWALPHPRDMAAFIPLWNECRRHLELAGASVSWRLSFHSGMNAAETSACRGIRILAPFIPLWNECRRDFGLPGHPYRLRIGT